MLNAYVFDGARTAFGRHAGALASVRPDDLVAHLLRTVAKRSPMAAQAEDVVLGCTCQAGEDSRNIARHAALLAGLGAGVPGQTVNRLCGSGLAAVPRVHSAVVQIPTCARSRGRFRRRIATTRGKSGSRGWG